MDRSWQSLAALLSPTTLQSVDDLHFTHMTPVQVCTERERERERESHTHTHAHTHTHTQTCKHIDIWQTDGITTHTELRLVLLLLVMSVLLYKIFRTEKCKQRPANEKFVRPVTSLLLNLLLCILMWILPHTENERLSNFTVYCPVLGIDAMMALMQWCRHTQQWSG